MKTLVKQTFQPDWTVPPGSMLEEKIAEMGLTVEAMAKKIELTPKEARRLLEGEIVLTDEIADKLETLTGISHEVWNRWEQTYRDDLVRFSSLQE
jgi:HTH-type transcriptional regulator/antitoxin HigA